jgi:hypothetical protein
LHWLNLNCASIIGRSFTNCVFYVDRNSKMTTTAGHSFYIGPIGSFYDQVNDTGSWEPLGFFFLASFSAHQNSAVFLCCQVLVQFNTCFFFSPLFQHIKIQQYFCVVYHP